MAVALTSTSPSVGGEGDNIRLNGSGLSGVTSVKFGGTEAASFTIVNSGRIQAIMPAQAGAVPNTVEVIDATSSASRAFTILYPGPWIYPARKTHVAMFPLTGSAVAKAENSSEIVAANGTRETDALTPYWAPPFGTAKEVVAGARYGLGDTGAHNFNRVWYAYQQANLKIGWFAGELEDTSTGDPDAYTQQVDRTSGLVVDVEVSFAVTPGSVGGGLPSGYTDTELRLAVNGFAFTPRSSPFGFVTTLTTVESGGYILGSREWAAGAGAIVLGAADGLDATYFNFESGVNRYVVNVLAYAGVNQIAPSPLAAPDASDPWQFVYWDVDPTTYLTFDPYRFRDMYETFPAPATEVRPLRRRQQAAAVGSAPRRRQIANRAGSLRRGPGAAP